MAKFGECFNLVLPKSDVLLSGIESSNVNSHIFITLDGKTVILYNIEDQKIIQDWTVRGARFTSPAVCYGDPQKLSVVVNHTTIRSWKRDQINLEKGKKISTQKPVHRLWTPPGLEVPVIVYTDGSCAVLDESKTLLINPQIGESDTILWSGCVQGEESNAFVIVFDEKEEKLVKYVVYSWEQGRQNVLCTKHKICPASAGRHIVDYSLCYHGSMIYLFILESQGEIDRICLLGTKNKVSGSVECLGVVSGMTDISAISAIDDQQMAVVGTYTKLSKYGICIWDSKFKLLQTFQPTRKLQTNSLIFNVQCHLYLTNEDGHYAFPYTPAKTTLAAALGKSSLYNRPTASGHKDSLHILRDLIQTLVDKVKTPDKKKFVKSFTELCDKLRSLKSGDALLLAQEFLKLVERIASEKFWVDTCVVDLIKLQVLQGSHLALLMRALVEHEETDIIHLALCTVRDIPELVLVQALQYYLQNFATQPQTHESDLDQDKDVESTEICKCPYSKNNATYLNKALRVLYNDVFIVDYIKDMDFQCLLSLLRYLHYLLTVVSAAPDATEDNGKPTIVQVVDWINLILDAHFAQIVLSADCRDVLLELHQVVESQVQFYDELVTLECILYQLKERAVLPRKQHIGSYCIQTLHVH